MLRLPSQEPDTKLPFEQDPSASHVDAAWTFKSWTGGQQLRQCHWKMLRESAASRELLLEAARQLAHERKPPLAGPPPQSALCIPDLQISETRLILSPQIQVHAEFLSDDNAYTYCIFTLETFQHFSYHLLICQHQSGGPGGCSSLFQVRMRPGGRLPNVLSCEAQSAANLSWEMTRSNVGRCRGSWCQHWHMRSR